MLRTTGKQNLDGEIPKILKPTRNSWIITGFIINTWGKNVSAAPKQYKHKHFPTKTNSKTLWLPKMLRTSGCEWIPAVQNVCCCKSYFRPQINKNCSRTESANSKQYFQNRHKIKKTCLISRHPQSKINTKRSSVHDICHTENLAMHSVLIKNPQKQSKFNFFELNPRNFQPVSLHRTLSQKTDLKKMCRRKAFNPKITQKLFFQKFWLSRRSFKRQFTLSGTFSTTNRTKNQPKHRHRYDRSPKFWLSLKT